MGLLSQSAARGRRRLLSVDAFAGIGGMSSGLRGLTETVAYIEWDTAAQQDLKSAQERGDLDAALIYGDVRGCTRKTMKLRPKTVDIITGGFPCQDLARIGKSKGLESKRSGMFYQLLRLVDYLRPKFIFIENVAGLLGSIPKVLCELDERGYDVRWDSVKAANFGAPHNRQRIFLLACQRPSGYTSPTMNRTTDALYAADEDKFHEVDTINKVRLRRKKAKGAKGVKKTGRSAASKAITSWRKPSKHPRVIAKGQKKRALGLCAALGNAVVPACVTAAFLHLFLGGSGLAEFDKQDCASDAQQLTAVACWLRRMEKALPEAGGLQTLWRASARAASGAGSPKPAGGGCWRLRIRFPASSAVTPSKHFPYGVRVPQAGVMFADKVVYPLPPLTATLPAFNAGAPSLPPGGITLVGNKRKSTNCRQTSTRIKRHWLSHLATPRHDGWGHCQVLTSRSKDDLITQLFFAHDQPSHGTRELCEEAYPNPAFVQHMMGYHSRWTKAPR